MNIQIKKTCICNKNFIIIITVILADKKGKNVDKDCIVTSKARTKIITKNRNTGN